MKASKRKPKTTELILTPLIDVVLFLMSFLLLVTEFSRQNEFADIILPDIKQAGIVENPDPQRLVLMIKESGHFYIGGANVPEAQVRDALAVEARLSRERATTLSNRLVLVGADVHTRWECIQKVITWCSDKDIRIWRLAFATKPGPPGGEPTPVRKAAP